MQKYEYCMVGPICERWSFSYPKLIFFTPSGMRYQHLSEERKSTSMPEPDYVASVIAKLGETGWEMVSTGSDGTRHYIYFKRTKE
jgi:hypothetical protein